MPRKLKPYKVDHVGNQKTGVNVEIMLDRDSQTFFGMVGTIRIEAESAKACKTAVNKALRDYTGMDWQPYIIIGSFRWDGHSTVNGYEESRTEISLKFHRLLGAKAVDGSWSSKPFEEDAPGGDGYHFKEEHYINRWYRPDEDDDYNYDNERVIPYTKEAWDTLLRMQTRIEEVGAFLRDLFKRDDIEMLLNEGRDLKLLKD